MFEIMYTAVIVREVLEQKVWVESETFDQAEEKVKEMYDKEEIVLDWENCVGVEFIPTKEVKDELHKRK